MKENILQVWQNIMLTIIAMAMIFYLFVGSTPEKPETIDVNVVNVHSRAFRGFSETFDVRIVDVKRGIYNESLDVNVQNSVLYIKEKN